MISYKFNLEQTQNNKVNLDKLIIELSLISFVVKKVYIFGNEIHVDVENVLTETQTTELTEKIANHDGSKALAFDLGLKEERSRKIDKMIQQSLDHPLIDSDLMVKYLTSIDNYLNGWIRSGKPQTLVNKVVLDTTTETQEITDLLNMTVNTDGNKFYEIIVATVSL